MANPLLAPFLRWLGRLSHPRLFLVLGVLFVIDLLIPNLVPWDDLLLGLATLLVARWKKPDAANAANSAPPPLR
jgi:ABC-type uncharacterized transport system YnjBCD ATPase subunit